MKLSTAISTPDAKFSALAFKGDYETSFSLVKKYEFDGLELHVRDPELVDTGQVKQLMAQHELEIPAIGTGRAFGEDGLSFSDPDISVRDAAVERIQRHIDLAAELNAHIIIGLILGKNPKTAESVKNATDCMKQCAVYAADRDIELFVEPINRYETSFIITADDCLEFFAGVDMPNCKVLLDTFHMNIEEADICGTIRKVGARIGHVHVADSNRRYPGAGHLDFPEIVAALNSVGYDRFLSAEMFPDPGPEVSLPAMQQYLRKILRDISD